MATVETTAQTIDPREAWLAERASGIGASESASAIGVDPYRSPIELWSTKCGLTEPDDISGKLPVKIGNRLEALVIEEFAEQSGRLVTPWPQYHSIKHPDFPFITCTPDAEELNPDCLDERISLVQVKAVSAYMDRQWKHEAPLHYIVQCQHELAVVGCQRATLVALVGNSHLRWFDLERDDAFIDALLQRLDEFWACVQNRIPPAIDWSESCSLALKKLHPQDSGAEVQLPEEAAEWDAELRDAKAKIKELEQVEKLNENRLKAAIADATYGVLPDGSRYSWATRDRKGYTVEATTYRQLTRIKSK